MIKKYIITTLLLITIISIGYSADSNGVWHHAEDIRPGIFGADEGISTGFSFINPVSFNEQVIINNHNLIINNGNVGVGTALPTQKLDVIGNIRSSGEIISTNANQFRQVYGNYGIIHRNNGVNYFMLLTDSANPYGTYNSLRPFRINNENGDVYLGSNALYVEHAGNVGIGTASPTQKLDVNGKIRMRAQTQSTDPADIVATKSYVDNLIPPTVYTSIQQTTVMCDMEYNGATANSWGCTATCPSGYTVTGGGFNWGRIYTTGGRNSYASGNGWRCDVGITGCSTGTIPCGGTCRAVCIRLA